MNTPLRDLLKRWMATDAESTASFLQEHQETLLTPQVVDELRAMANEAQLYR